MIKETDTTQPLTGDCIVLRMTIEDFANLCTAKDYVLLGINAFNGNGQFATSEFQMRIAETMQKIKELSMRSAVEG